MATARLHVDSLLSAALRSDVYRHKRADIEMKARRLAEDMLVRQAEVLAVFLSERKKKTLG